MENTTIPEGFRVCTITGYLESLDGTGVTVKAKSAFLKHFKKSGDKTKAIETQGFRFTDLEWHLQNDANFKRDYRETLLAMKHELESMMYESAFKASGHRDRQKWLEVNFPDEYGKVVKPKGQKNKSKLDGLLEEF